MEILDIIPSVLEGLERTGGIWPAVYVQLASHKGRDHLPAFYMVDRGEYDDHMFLLGRYIGQEYPGDIVTRLIFVLSAWGNEINDSPQRAPGWLLILHCPSKALEQGLTPVWFTLYSGGLPHPAFSTVEYALRRDTLSGGESGASLLLVNEEAVTRLGFFEWAFLRGFTSCHLEEEEAWEQFAPLFSLKPTPPCDDCGKSHLGALQQLHCPLRPGGKELYLTRYGELGTGAYTVTDRVRYRLGNDTLHTGTILWLVPPYACGEKLAPDDSLRYVILRHVPRDATDDEAIRRKRFLAVSTQGPAPLDTYGALFGFARPPEIIDISYEDEIVGLVES